jgi:uncharacterized membrane protein (DUF485 family)
VTRITVGENRRVRSRSAEPEVPVSQQPPYDDGTRRTGAAPVDESAIYLQVQQTPDFQLLRSRFRRFVFPMTAVFLGWYLLYVIASGWARDFMSKEVIGNINVAYLFGLSQFVSTFLIAWLYERYMNRHVDPRAREIALRMKEIAR